MLGQIKTVIVVAGCQRSGTTLVGNILGCHRQALLVDEDNQLYEWVERCLLSGQDDPEFTESTFAQADEKYKGGHRRIHVVKGRRKLRPEIDTLVLKAPNLTYSFEALSKLPQNVQVVYPVRDPRAVVASMERLSHIDMVGNQVKWMEKSPQIAAMFGDEILKLADPSVPVHVRRAIVWQIKSGLFKAFETAGLNPFVFQYEDLVQDKESVLRKMTSHMGLSFDNKMTRHESFYRGLAPGLTLRARAVDSSSTLKWKNRLGPRQVREILEAADPLAKEQGYFNGTNGHFVRSAPKFSRDIFESPVILTGRGGSGTRLISEIAQKLNIFLGNQLNFAGDSLEWVDLIYEYAIKKTIATTRGRLFQEDIGGPILDKVQDILEGGDYDLEGSWGWKLPETMLIVPEMMKIFPQAKLVHMVRHPVTSCLRRTHMTSRNNNPVGRAVLRGAYQEINRNPKNIETDPEYLHNAVTWLYQVRRVHEFAMNNLSAENYHLVKFEDLLSNPLESSRKLSRFLTGKANEFVRPVVDGERANGIDYTDPAVNHIWEICGGVAAEFGYRPLSVPAPIQAYA